MNDEERKCARLDAEDGDCQFEMPELVFDPRRPRIRRNLLRGRVHYVGMEMKSHGDWKKILLAEKLEIVDPSRMHAEKRPLHTRVDMRTRILFPIF